MVNGKDNSGIGKVDPLGELDSEDLRLGRKAVKIKTVFCIVAFAVCVVIAGFIFINVPWGTRMPYQGKYNHSGSGIPMQVAMLPSLLVLLSFWRTGKKPTAHHMGKKTRIAYYILAPAIILACVVAQWGMARSILVAGGYLAG